MTDTDTRRLPDWMADHLRRYLETDGEDGHVWRGVSTLLLTTTGRRSGRSLQLPLIYGEDSGRYLLVASKGGHPSHPAWYLNLAAQPEVDLQVGAERFEALASTATGDERSRLWSIMEKIWPAYSEYQEATEREIPVVVLERV